jgi:hypothetical protein
VLEESFLGDACGKHGQFARLDRFLCLIWEMAKLPDNFSCFQLPNQTVRIYKSAHGNPLVTPIKHTLEGPLNRGRSLTSHDGTTHVLLAKGY